MQQQYLAIKYIINAGAAFDQLIGGREQAESGEAEVLLQGVYILAFVLLVDLHPD